MTCADYQEWISADLDAELREDDEPALWDHLAGCPTCRGWRRDVQAIHTDFSRWPEEALPARDAPGQIVHKSRVYHVPRLVAWAAILALFVEAFVLTSPLQRFRATVPPAGGPVIETVETITLGPADRVEYRVVDRSPSAKQSSPNRIGG